MMPPFGSYWPLPKPEASRRRGIAGKSLLLPWGVETPISFLLPGRHQVLLIVLRKVLEKAGRSLTDAQLMEVVRRDFNFKVSRRSINACRHELSEKS